MFDGETYEAEREVMVERGNPYAVKWDMAWFEFDLKETDEDPPYSVTRSAEEFEEDSTKCGHMRAYRVVTHHHVAVTKRAKVTDKTEAERTALSIIDDYPEVDSLEFTFEKDRVNIAFENHEGGPLVCSLEEVARSTKKRPRAVYLGHGKLVAEDESWTMCQQHVESLKKKKSKSSPFCGNSVFIAKILANKSSLTDFFF